MAHDQIVARIQSRFSGHALTDLVDAVLQGEGWVTKVSPPGPDGGVDILAGRGSLGLDGPRLCVQVKSQKSPADVTVYRTLLGTMQTFKAEQGLLVCWGGFNKTVLQESKQAHFTVRLWESKDLVGAIYRNYDGLPAEIPGGTSSEEGLDARGGGLRRLIIRLTIITPFHDLLPRPEMHHVVRSQTHPLGSFTRHSQFRELDEAPKTLPAQR